MNKAIIPLAIFILLVGLFLWMLARMNAGEYNPRDIPTEWIGRTAPDFSLPNLHQPNRQVSPKQYLGKVWLLNVWGTWCPECWREHDFLLQLARQNVPILGLNWRDTAMDAKNMLARLGNPFDKVAFDPNSDAVIDWGVYGAPETFLVDAQGIIREKHKGALTSEIWREKFAGYFE